MNFSRGVIVADLDVDATVVALLGDERAIFSSDAAVRLEGVSKEVDIWEVGSKTWRGGSGREEGEGGEIPKRFYTVSGPTPSWSASRKQLEILGRRAAGAEARRDLRNRPSVR